jgi:hypothetical protein
MVKFRGEIAADSSEGQRTEELYNVATNYRGPILDQLVFIDLFLADYLAAYFASNEDRRRVLREEVLIGMNIEAKIDLFTKTVGAEQQALIRDLDDLRGLRNDLAHSTIDVSDQAMTRFAESKEVTFLVHKRGKKRTRSLTPELLHGQLRKCSASLLAIHAAEDALR